MVETNLRQADAIARVVGVVSEKDLKFYKLGDKGDTEVQSDDQADAIKGSVTIKTSNDNFVRFNVNVAKKTKAGKDNPVYPGMLTVKNDYKSIAEVGADGGADVVSIKGDVNLYQSTQTGEEVISYKSNFFNRVRNVENYTPKAEFEIEMFISGIVPEVDNDGEETGRLKVKGVVPGYEGRSECVTLIAPTDDGLADAIDSTFEVGQTSKFYGDIKVNREVVTREIPVAVGKPKIETTYNNVNELIITGAEAPYEEGVTPNAPYDKDTIAIAMQERKSRFEARKAKAQGGTPTATANARPSAKSSGRTLGF